MPWALASPADAAGIPPAAVSPCLATVCSSWSRETEETARKGIFCEWGSRSLGGGNFSPDCVTAPEPLTLPHLQPEITPGWTPQVSFLGGRSPPGSPPDTPPHARALPSLLLQV